MYKGIKQMKIKTMKIKTIPIRSTKIKGFTQKRKNTKIRNPLKYLTEKHGVPKRTAQKFLVQPAFIHKYWKEDNSGLYIDKEMLDSIGYGWKEERKEFMSSIESTEKVRTAAYKSWKEEEGKIPTKKEMEERIEKMPKKYQKGLRKIQRVMKKIRG